ncbi:MAG: acetyl-CoA acetyltransferase [Dehalococcoidia bacterium]|nr:acetyl-CoA acetyltransferase [Dehalococcoidia bacterium]
MQNNLRDKYCIVGVGETDYSRGSGRSTRALAVEAIRNAVADAGLTTKDIDGMLSYHGGDSTSSSVLAYDLGNQLNFYMDCSGGGSSTEALVGLAIGSIEAGMCETVAIFRAMNGYSQVRIGGTGRGAAPVTSADLLRRPYGLASAVQTFAFSFTRHMMEYGVKSEDLAAIKVTHSNHASNNPKALMKHRVTVDDVMNSRWIVRPCAHLLDCCLETDNATCIIITSAERAKDMKNPPAYIRAVQGRGTKPGGDFHYQHAPITRVAGHYVGPRLFELADLTHDDIDVTGCYDAFTYTSLLQFEDYGFCKKGEGKDYVTSGITDLGGRRPNNTSGGHLCEGYTHGMNMVIENVRQLRGTVDDYCPDWQNGNHTFEYSEGGCRRVPNVEITMNMGWANPATGSALIMRK